MPGNTPNKQPQTIAFVPSTVVPCRFRESSAAWEEEYATAFCKLSSFGASFAPGKVSFEDVFSGPSQPCLSVAETLSLQQCPVCDLAHYDSISGVGGGNVPPPPAADSPPAPAPAPAEPPVEDPSSADSAVPDDSAVPALEARATTQPAAGPGAADSAAPIVEVCSLIYATACKLVCPCTFVFGCQRDCLHAILLNML